MANKIPNTITCFNGPSNTSFANYIATNNRANILEAK